MSRRFPPALCALIFAICIGTHPSSSFAATSTGGACPSAANYLSSTTPQTGGGQGSVTLASLGVTSCFYISAAGSDSNSGVDENHPWLHAPKMPACSSTCASVTPSAGTGFIFRGGDTWHFTSGSVLTGGTISISQSGTSSSPIYWGIDPGWSSTSSFARPIFSMDNPLSTSFVSSCATADDNSSIFFSISGSHNWFDGFEFTGACWNGNPTGMIFSVGTNNTFARMYMHGWTAGTSASDDMWHFAGGPGAGGTTNTYLFNVIDGVDSTAGALCNSSTCVASVWSGGGVPSPIPATLFPFVDCGTLAYNVVRHASQGCEANNTGMIHDNLFEFLFEPGYGRHGNVIESIGGTSGSTCYFYNNVTRNTNEGVNWWPQCSTFYVFNNVWENSGHYAPDPNGLMLSPTGLSGSGTVTAYVFNNTFQANKAQAGPANSATPSWASGSTVSFENNQILDFTSIGGFFTCTSGDSCDVNDSGGEVFQTTAAANAQGYVLSNNYAPNSASGATVSAGNSGSYLCGQMSNSAAATACASATSGGVVEQSGWGGKIATYSAIALAQRTGSWDAGAYQFTNANSLAPPTGLAAQIQ